MGNLLSSLQQTPKTQQQPENRMNNNEVGVELGLKDGESRTSSNCSNAFKSNNKEIEKEKEAAAAVKLQKVYRSYRTRRSLADCAVVAEELWWQAIEYATLTQSTELYYDDDKPDTAVSRWSRATVKAAKVGKGLSKDEKAKRLAFQHWLEAIDPRHRYGHNLHYYYDEWYRKPTAQPFFYWLDVGDGRDLNLVECPRSTLQKQRIKYLSRSEREQYEVVVNDGKIVYKQNQQPAHTPEGSKWIFVLSTSQNLYVGEKKKGRFQHSSFLSGAATSAAGRLIVDNGNLKRRSSDGDLSNEFEENGLSSKEDRKEQVHCEKQEENTMDRAHIANNVPHAKIKNVAELQPNVEKEVPDAKTDICFTSHDLVHENGMASVKKQEQFQDPKESSEAEGNEEIREIHFRQESKKNVYYKKSLSSKDLENQLPELPCKEWLQSSRKSSESYQLGKRSSGKWTTGTGLRIGFVAAYPVELRFEALKQVNLSPRVTSPYSPKGQPSTS